MNPQWKEFLLANRAVFKADGRITFPPCSDKYGKQLYPIVDLSVLSVTGKDAACLLQGQSTCDINKMIEQKASLGAFCNPKGRVIATFLILKQGEGFLLILPTVLLAPVKQRLQMYVLRSVVTLTDCSNTLCLIGISSVGASKNQSFEVSRHKVISVYFPTLNGSPCRQLLIAEPEKAMALWSQSISEQSFQAESSDRWRYLDIISGIPWLNLATSEAFIPQMLNLDELGGVSFTKGCYTGQEIVARTHYLGKAKRAMFVAECQIATEPAANTAIFDDTLDASQSIGHVITAQCQNNTCNMLIVIPISNTGFYNLKLADQTPLTLLSKIA